MHLINRSLCVLFMLCAQSQANCVAQELPNRFKPRVVFERDVEQAPKGHPPMLSYMFDSRKTAGGIATLTRLGTELLLNDPANSRILVVDTKTFVQSQIPLSTPAVHVRIQSQTDMLFVNTYVPNGKLEAIQTCYENLSALRNQQALWSLPTHHFQQICWLDEHQQFIALGNGRKPTLLLLDRQGANLAEHKFDGWIQGIDETENGFNIFYLESQRGAVQLALTRLDNKFKLSKTQRLPLVDKQQSPPAGCSSLGIAENFRMRGLKSGEVTKYFLNIASQPGYFEMRGRLPINNLTSRFFYSNKLSAAESSLQPEIIVGVVRGDRIKSVDGFILFDQQYNYYYEPDQWLKDAFFDEERKLIVTVADSKKPGHWKVRLVSFE